MSLIYTIINHYTNILTAYIVGDEVTLFDSLIEIVGRFFSLLWVERSCTKSIMGNCLFGGWDTAQCLKEMYTSCVVTTYEFSIQRLCLLIFLVLLVILKCTLIYYYCVRDNSSVVGNDLVSKIIHFVTKHTQQYDTATCTLRSLFMSCPGVENHNARNHTHPVSAKVRNNGASFMDLYSVTTGKGAYFIQKSAADVRHNRRGCRTYHWGKDFSVDYESFNPLPDDMLCIVDVDMYLQMNKLLSQEFRPVLLTTFQPSALAKSAGEYTFTFNSHNEVNYVVSGGAAYSHKVWNYGSDVVVAKNTTWYGKHIYHVYNVDRRQMDGHHQLILLTPIKRIVSYFFDVSRWISGSHLDYLKVVETHQGSTFTRLNVITPDGCQRSTGKPDEFVVATISAKDDDTLACMARSGKTDIVIATIKTVIPDVDQTSASILAEYHKMKTGRVPDYVFPVSESVFRFQHSPREYDSDAKSCLIPFMSPVILGCYAPDRCLQNDKAAIQGRVTSVTPSSDIKVTSRMLIYMQEFVDFLIPDQNKGHPVDYDEVRDKQFRPAQRAILDRASDVAQSVVDQPIQSFQKSEAYEKITDPRIISTVPGVNKLNYSRFIYSFTLVLRATPWYAFALTPSAIASRVTKLCTNTAVRLFLTDLSRFDGRVSVVLRTLEQMAMIRYFSVQYHKELNELMADRKSVV